MKIEGQNNRGVTKFMSMAGLALGMALIASFARGDEGGGDWTYALGPCKKLQTTYPTIPQCYNGTCSLWCDDPCGYVISQDGFCKNQKGDCTQWTFDAEFQMCRDCTCTGTCRNDGPYVNSTIAFTKCVDGHM